MNSHLSGSDANKTLRKSTFLSVDSEWAEWYEMTPSQRWTESDKLWAFYLQADEVEAHLTRNPIRKVLSTLRSHNVRFLLIGGQACVFYGAAEFSRDTDIVILAEPANLKKL